MAIGAFLFLLLASAAAAVLFNPVIWIRIALALAPPAKRADLVAEMRRLAMLQPPSQALMYSWLIDRAVGKGERGDGTAVSEAGAEPGGSGGVHGADVQDHQRPQHAGHSDQPGGDPR